jgi:hypothetical protein
VNHPSILLDEPTGNLDTENSNVAGCFAPTDNSADHPSDYVQPEAAAYATEPPSAMVEWSRNRWNHVRISGGASYTRPGTSRMLVLPSVFDDEDAETSPKARWQPGRIGAGIAPIAATPGREQQARPSE